MIYPLVPIHIFFNLAAKSIDAIDGQCVGRGAFRLGVVSAGLFRPWSFRSSLVGRVRAI